MYVCLHACDLRKFCSLGFLAIAAVHAAVYSDATHIEEHLPLQATHAPDTDKRHVAPAPTICPQVSVHLVCTAFLGPVGHEAFFPLKWGRGWSQPATFR